MPPRLGNMPMMALSKVDLPAPLGPITLTMLPAATLTEMSLIASTLP